jgi:hypothetical protein
VQVATTWSTPAVAALDVPEGVEGLHERDAERPRRLTRRVAGHPEVRVHDVGLVVAPRRLQDTAERRHVLEQVVLGDGARRAGVDVVDEDAGAQLDVLGEGRVVAPRVHDDLRAAPCHRLRERGDVDVLPSGVRAAQHRERARVLGDHRDPHDDTSSSRASQSARNRCSP